MKYNEKLQKTHNQVLATIIHTRFVTLGHTIFGRLRKNDITKKYFSSNTFYSA